MTDPMTSFANGLDSFIRWITTQVPGGLMLNADFMVRALIAIVLVSLVAGAVGSLVVSNRMAFFSDALAHCAFAGVGLGLLIALVIGADSKEFSQWLMLIRVGFGIAFGVGIAYVREKTLLPSDTIIGVFFAAALALGAIFQKEMNKFRLLSVESFIFGDPLEVTSKDLLWLFLLVLLTVLFLVFCYNSLMFGGFNVSLARSRRVPARLAQYLFIVLLGVIVNLCQQTVGILLINGLLIVPGAAAANLSRNLRQLMWWSIAITLTCGILGVWLSWEISANFNNFHVGVGGTVLMLSVLMFVLSMAMRRYAK